MDSMDAQMLYNELNKLERAIDSREKRISQLLKKKSRSSEWVRRKRRPRRYSVELSFDVGVLVPESNSFVVDDKTIFRPSSIEYSIRTTFFSLPGDPVASLVTASLPTGDPSDGARNGVFGFLWEIRDSGSDRDWQNAPMPDPYLNSGIIAPLYMGERAVLSKGTEVSINVIPILNRTAFSGVNGNIVKQTVQISMIGHEEFVK